MLSFGGRLILVKSVLSAIPIHYMQAIKIPKWVFNHIDRIRRNFLWKGHLPCKPINCLVNWERTCALREEGGLGIIRLQTQNDALLTKWIWILQYRPLSNWAQTLRLLYEIEDIDSVGNSKGQSFFLKDLKSLKPFYEASTVTEQNGVQLRWRWEENGLFSTSSAYKMIHRNGVNWGHHRKLWKLKAPPKVRFFVWILLHNRLLTRAVLRRRGCQVPDGCALCGTDARETDVHMF